MFSNSVVVVIHVYTLAHFLYISILNFIFISLGLMYLQSERRHQILIGYLYQADVRSFSKKINLKFIIEKYILKAN